LCQARHDRAAAAADARSAVVLAPWLARVHHHQLFFAGMDNRRAAPRALIRRRGEKRRPLKPPPPVAARPAPAAPSWRCSMPRPPGTTARSCSTCAATRHQPILAWALHLALWRARTRAEHLTWASILGARALSPALLH
jgi:hypothetical protein